ncbi:cloacin immunity family protein [Pseudomonas sp. CVAP|uniref:Cloacin n=1 Tax=Pseudomonas fluorescens HK44 TaxID=1042209 RepID=A0A010RQD3_PSEFL|nr:MULTISPECIES: colicin E3-like toxin immunity protein [Pseudomonas]EXF91259.1 cloacin [Pseudomonas fluorescens HK44]MBU6958644.1 cloacin immunity family protein [Pseudomonas sp. CVAP\
MGMKVRLEWYDKETEALAADEFSIDFGDDDSILAALGLSNEPEIFDGGFDVLPKWVAMIQPHFNHQIDTNLFDYQISFRYRNHW